MIKEKISVILPAYNEEDVIGEMVRALLLGYGEKIKEIIVIDDSSTDNTSGVVESVIKTENKVRLVRKGPPSGVGAALKAGFKNINRDSEYVLTMDSDFIDSIGEICALIEIMESGGCDGVIGSRFMEGGKVENYPLLKKIMNRVFHFIVRLLFNIKQKDLTNNFKLYKADIIKKIPWRSDSFAINAETGILPILAGYRIVEAPVSWIGRKEGMGRSKFRLFNVGLDYVKVILYARDFVQKKNKRVYFAIK